MYWNRTTTASTEAWSAAIARMQETGGVPLLTGGAPAHAVTAWPTLAALQTLAAQRDDRTVPHVLLGGPSAIWTAALLSPHPSGPGPWPRDPVVLFAGADPTTVHAATAGLHATLTPPGLRDTIAAHWALEFAPRLEPAAAAGWESLPFVEMGESGIPLAPVPSAAPDGDEIPSIDWAAWGTLLLALSLVLSAVLI